MTEITGENGCDRLYDIPELDGLSDENKERFIIQILDYMRHKLCIYSDDRTEEAAKDIEKQVRENLKSPWTLDDNDRITASHALCFVKPQNKRKAFGKEVAGYRSKLAFFVRDFLNINGGTATTVIQKIMFPICNLYLLHWVITFKKMTELTNYFIQAFYGKKVMKKM